MSKDINLVYNAKVLSDNEIVDTLQVTYLFRFLFYWFDCINDTLNWSRFNKFKFVILLYRCIYVYTKNKEEGEEWTDHIY